MKKLNQDSVYVTMVSSPVKITKRIAVLVVQLVKLVMMKRHVMSVKMEESNLKVLILVMIVKAASLVQWNRINQTSVNLATHHVRHVKDL